MVLKLQYDKPSDTDQAAENVRLAAIDRKHMMADTRLCDRISAYVRRYAKPLPPIEDMSRRISGSDCSYLIDLLNKQIAKGAGTQHMRAVRDRLKSTK